MTFENQYFQYFEQLYNRLKMQPLYLGGVTGSGGGFGGPPGGFLGYLPQTKVTFDLSEIATSGIPSSGMSLLDNLNRIRYRISALEAGGGSGISSITILKDSIELSDDVIALNFLDDIDVNIVGQTANISIIASGSGSGNVVGSGILNKLAVWDDVDEISYRDFISIDETYERLNVGFDNEDGPGTKISLGRDNAIGAGLGVTNFHSTTPLPYLTFRSGRGTQASPSPNLSGDVLGQISAVGQKDGTVGIGGTVISARIKLMASDDWSSGDTPSKIVFQTTPDSSGTARDAVIIDSTGQISSIYDSLKLNEKEFYLDTAMRFDGTDAASGYGLRFDGTKWVAFDLASSYFRTELSAINTETLSGNKTLVDSDATIHFLNPNATNRDVTLPANGATNHAFSITNTSDTWNYRITVKKPDTTVLAVLSRGESKYFYSNGTTWVTNMAKDFTVANGSHYFVVDCDTSYDNFFTTKTAINFETINSAESANITFSIKSKGTGTPGFTLKRSATDAFSIYNDGNTHIKAQVGSDMYFNQNLAVNWVVSYGAGGNPTYDFYGRRTTDTTYKKLRFQVNTNGDANIWSDTARNLYLGDNLTTLLYLEGAKLGVGISPAARFHILGSSDINQVLVKGYSTQTNSIIKILKSDDSTLLEVDNAGKITALSDSMILNSKTFQLLAGITLDPTGASVGHILGYDGSKWVPTTVSGIASLATGNARFTGSDMVIASGYSYIVSEDFSIIEGFSLSIEGDGILEVI